MNHIYLYTSISPHTIIMITINRISPTICFRFAGLLAAARYLNLNFNPNFSTVLDSTKFLLPYAKYSQTCGTMRTFVALLLVAAASAAVRARSSIRAQANPGDPIVLLHEGLAGSSSSVAVTCAGDGVTLTLSQDVGSTGKVESVKFVIGDGSDPACVKEEAYLDAAKPSISASGDSCQRLNGIWDVKVEETISSGPLAIERIYTASLKVKCNPEASVETGLVPAEDLTIPINNQGDASAPVVIDFR